MDADFGRENELEAGQPHSVGGEHSVLERLAREAYVELHRRRRVRNRVCDDVDDLERLNPREHETLVALGACAGDLGEWFENPRRVRAADDRGNSELASDDRRVRRPSPLFRQDQRRFPHEGLPVGSGQLGHQYVSGVEDALVHRDVFEFFSRSESRAQLSFPHDHLIITAVHPDAACSDPASDRVPTKEHLVVLHEFVDDSRVHAEALVGGASLLIGVNGLGPCLYDVQLSGVAVLRPLHVDRTSVVPFDGQCHPREFERFFSGNGPLTLPTRLHVHALGRRATLGRIDELHVLRAELTMYDGRLCLGSSLPHDDGVGGDAALDDEFAEPVGRGDVHDVGIPRIRVQREEHPRGRDVGADHLHDDDPESSLQGIHAAL